MQVCIEHCILRRSLGAALFFISMKQNGLVGIKSRYKLPEFKSSLHHLPAM